MNFVFLCAFGLFAIVRCQEPSADEAKKYSQCFAEGLCNVSDLSTKKELISCFTSLSPKVLQSLFDFPNPIDSDTFPEAITQYCGFDDATHQKVANKLIDSDFSLQKKTAADGEGSAESDLEKATNCVYKIVTKLQSDGKCSKD